MKTSLLVLFACISVACSNAQPKTDVQSSDLMGKVKSVKTIQTYRYKKDGVNFTPWEKTYTRVTKFNKDGNRTEYAEYTNKDSLTYKMTYTYNLKDKKGEVVYLNKELKPTAKYTYIYNDKNWKTEELQYGIDEKLSRRYVNSYDERGNLTKTISYKADGTISNTNFYTYNEKGQRIEMVTETPGYATSSRTFVNDDKGNILEEAWLDGKRAITFRFVRTYDDKGNKIKEVKYRLNYTTPSDTVTWKYEFDKKGNWVKRTEVTKNGEDFNIEERTIEYF